MEKTIYEKLNDWAVERSISKQTSDRNGFCANIVEELGEFDDAIVAEDTHELLDALSDIRVFCIVETTKFNIDVDFTNKVDIEEDLNITVGIVKYLSKFLESKSDEDKISNILKINQVAYEGLIMIGYNPDDVLEETYKEINSRTGEWSDEAQKWQKYKTPEAMALWYKSDYSNCKTQ